MSTTEIDWIIKVEEGAPHPLFFRHKFWFWYVVEQRTTTNWTVRDNAEPIITKTPYSQGTSWSKDRAVKAAKKYVDDVVKGRMYRQESDNDILHRGQPVDY
jgi:hypothetical protein